MIFNVFLVIALCVVDYLMEPEAVVSKLFGPRQCSGMTVNALSTLAPARCSPKFLCA
jgi:hypothetical protein